tara:strand:- start:870 stop:2213 length:1344 start_codon:yes stop_codon:yes gene_type:complete
MAYVVALAEGDGPEALKVAEASCALAMLQGEGFPLPSFSAAVEGYDALGDRLRPADGGTITFSGEKPQSVSQAHKDRWNFGRDQRQAFYERMAEEKPSRAMTDDFASMVGNPPAGLPKSLNGKFAVFFADGNGIGKMREAAIAAEGLQGLSKFSKAFKDLQKGLLRNIVGWLDEGAENRPLIFLDSQEETGDPTAALRFETLMWGGDEIVFVMPSWLALEFAARFDDWTKDWALASGPNGAKSSVTFSCGLVVAPSKTPIRQVKAVAEDLVEGLKSMPDVDEGTNRLQIEIFESLALPETDIASYRMRLFGADATFDNDQERNAVAKQLSSALAIAKRDGVETLRKRLVALKDDEQGIPRSQLYRLLRQAGEEAYRAGSEDDASLQSAYDVYLQRAGADHAPDLPQLNVMAGIGDGQQLALALNLAVIASLWDYVLADGFGRGADHG